MGRTNPTHRMILRALEDRWQPYRRSLRHADQPHFDALFAHAREHADAATYQNHHDPLIPLLIAVALEHEKHLDSLDDRLAQLEEHSDQEG